MGAIRREIDPLDRRIHAWRPDLADVRLSGRVEADRFVEGEPAHVIEPWCDLRRVPDPGTGIDSQLLLGDPLLVFERQEGWAWVQSQRDGYVGWTSQDDIAEGFLEPSHLVCAPRTFVYPGPDMKLPACRALSMGSAVNVTGSRTTRGTEYLLLDNGEALVAAHLRAADIHDEDYVAVAERLIGTPYLWGGATAMGLDCSGLVQLAMRQCGRHVPRDSDMQFASLGEAFDPSADLAALRRGDLVFWKGHVAIVAGPSHLLHANGFTMDVALEPLTPALARIARVYAEPAGFARP